MSSRSTSIQRVLWIVLALNLAVTAIKLIIGFASGALSVVADGFHSIVDSSSNIIGLVGVWIAARPADSNHPYGHAKYETIATLSIGGMLLVASFEIGKSVFERLFGGQAEPEISSLTIGLMALTFIVNVGITVYETRAGRRLKSDILLADAAHTRTDLFVTLSVIASLIGARLGFSWLDPLVAGLVVILLVRAAYGILRSASDVLTDVAVADPEAVRRSALAVPGVRWVTKVRSRGRADAAYVDMHVKVNPAMDTVQAHALASEVERRVRADVPGVVDTVVHIEPARPPEGVTHWEHIALTLRGLADGLGLGLHDLHAHIERDGRYALEMHIEVEASLTLGAAHARVDEFERHALAALPEVETIITHIEPLPTALPGEAGDIERNTALLQKVVDTANELAGPGAGHNVELHNLDGHLTATLHITQSADTPLTQAHALAERIESQLHTREAWLHRVVVHVEPPE